MATKMNTYGHIINPQLAISTIKEIEGKNTKSPIQGPQFHSLGGVRGEI